MTTDAQPHTLTTAIGTYGHTRAIKSGAIAPEGVTFEQVEVSPIIAAFRRMVRALEFDVCEMAITTYLCAREYHKPFTALPVFPVRGFRHGATLVNLNSGVRQPRDLEGKQVGVRAWTVTTGVWAKDILQKEYGVNIDAIDWLVADEEHVAEYEAPPNVTRMIGANLSDMLVRGEIAAAIGIGNVDAPHVKPLIVDAAQAERTWYEKTGIYPINHTLVVKDELLAANPSLGKDIYGAFKAARDEYVAGMASGGAMEDAALRQAAEIVGDPLPYGVEPNRKALAAIVDAAVAQQILNRPVAVEAMFAAEAAGW